MSNKRFLGWSQANHLSPPIKTDFKQLQLRTRKWIEWVEYSKSRGIIGDKTQNKSLLGAQGRVVGVPWIRQEGSHEVQFRVKFVGWLSGHVAMDAGDTCSALTPLWGGRHLPLPTRQSSCSERLALLGEAVENVGSSFWLLLDAFSKCFRKRSGVRGELTT